MNKLAPILISVIAVTLYLYLPNYFLAPRIAEAALTDSLVSYWELGEASGTRDDAHGSNDLTDNNTVTSATGKVGDAADFERGNTEYLSHASNSDLRTGDIDFTFAGWVNLESKPASGMPIVFSKWGATDFEYIFYFNVGFDQFDFAIRNAADNANVFASSGVGSSIGTWYFFVCWYDATANTLNISINNGATVSTSISGGAHLSTADFKLGAYAETNLEPFDGLIDQVGFWKRTLTAAERTKLYNDGAGLTYAQVVTPPTKYLLVSSGHSVGAPNGSTSGAIDSTGADLIVVQFVDYPVNPGTLTDSEGNTWIPLTAKSTATDSRSRFYYAQSPITDVAHTFTASGASSYSAVSVMAFVGSASSPFDQENGSTAPFDNGGGSEAITTGSVTPTQDNELIVAAMSTNLATAFGSNADNNAGFIYTERQSSIGAQSFAYGMAYKVQTSATPVNPTFGWIPDIQYEAAAVIATFKAASAGGGGGGGAPTPSRTMRLFEGFTLKLISGTMILRQN